MHQKKKNSAAKKPSHEEEPFTDLKKNIPALRKKLLRWYDRNSRKYPWRKTKNWFHLLMAEMMLRRTRADQVLPVYKHFASNYRTPGEASPLSPKDLEMLFAPLGLKWRGRQMHKTIAFLKDNYSKRKPSKNDNLKLIPGVGDYANSMLRNRLFGEKCAAVDSNVARFFSRLAGIRFSPESRRKKHILSIADHFMNAKRSFDLNLAILDFSSAVCRAQKPLCDACTFKDYCGYNKSSSFFGIPITD